LGDQKNSVKELVLAFRMTAGKGVGP